MTAMTGASANERRAALSGELAQVATGDKAALDRVYRLTSAKLLGIIVHIVPERELAEDVLQEVYFRVWRRAGRFDPSIASPITWLATIARNCAIDEVRRRGRVSNHDADDVLAQLADDSPQVDDMLCEEEAHETVRRCLDALDKDQRTPIRLAFFGGFTYSQLAEKIGVPLSTLKSRIRRGLASLKGCVGYGRV